MKFIITVTFTVSIFLTLWHLYKYYTEVFIKEGEIYSPVGFTFLKSGDERIDSKAILSVAIFLNGWVWPWAFYVGGWVLSLAYSLIFIKGFTKDTDVSEITLLPLSWILYAGLTCWILPKAAKVHKRLYKAKDSLSEKCDFFKELFKK